jgi:hypothetical protein
MLRLTRVIVTTCVQAKHTTSLLTPLTSTFIYLPEMYSKLKALIIKLVVIAFSIGIVTLVVGFNSKLTYTMWSRTLDDNIIPNKVFPCRGSACKNSNVTTNLTSNVINGKVVIAGMLRDRQSHLSYIRPIVEQIGNLYKEYKILIVVR